MEVIHAETYEEAWREVCRRRESASGPTPLYRIIKSPYAGFDVVAVDPELYADALADELIDGLPVLPRLGKGTLRGLRHDRSGHQWRTGGRGHNRRRGSIVR